MDDKLKKLYSLYKSSGLIKTTDFNTFSKADYAQRKKIYDLGKSSGLIKSIDFNTFNTAFDSVPIKKKESTSKDSHFYSKALKEVGLSDIDQPKKQKASVSSGSKPVKEKQSDIFTGYPGKEDKIYRLDNSTGKPVWMEYSNTTFKGGKQIENYDKPITDPARVVALNKHFNVNASSSDIDEVFVGYPGKELNQYRVYNGEWQRMQKNATKWTSLTDEVAINSLNKQFNKNVKVPTNLSNKIKNDVPTFTDINTKLVSKTEENVVPYLQKKYGDLGFIFEETGFGTDYVKVTASNGKTMEVGLDESNPEEALKLRTFLELNGKSNTKNKINEFYDKVGLPKFSDAESGRVGGPSDEYIKARSVMEIESQKAINQYLDSEKYLKDFSELNYEEQKSEVKRRLSELRSNLRLARDTGNKDTISKRQKEVDDFYKSNVYKTFKVSKDNELKEVSNKIDKLYYSLKQAKTPEQKKIIQAEINSYLSNSFIKDQTDNYNIQLNDVSNAYNKIEEEKRLYEKDLNDFNNKVKSGAITEEQYKEMSASLLDRAEKLDKKSAEVRSNGTSVISQMKKLEVVTGKYLLAKEKTGGFWGNMLNSAVSGLSSIPETLVSSAISYRADIDYSMADPETKKYLKDKGFSAEEAKNIMNNNAKKAAKEQVKSKLIESIGTTGTTEEYRKSSDRGFFEKALSGVAESLPAMLIPGGAGMKITALSAQAYNSIEDEMLSDEDFQTTSQSDRAIVAVPYAIGMGILENIGVTSMMSKNPIAKTLIGKSLLNVAGKIGNDTTRELFEKTLEKEIKSNIAKFGLKVVGGTLAEAETGATQSLLLDIGLKDLYNAYKSHKDKKLSTELTGGEYFDTPDSFSEGFSMVLEDAAAEAIGGMVMTAATTSFEKLRNGDISLYNDKDIEFLKSISEDSEIKKIFLAKLKTDMLTGKLTKSEAQSKLDAMNSAEAMFGRIPDQITGKNLRRAYELTLEKDKLSKEIQGKDEALVSAQKERINAINEELKTISQNATKENGTVEYQGADEGQQKVGQGEGTVGQTTQQTTDTGDSTVASRGIKKLGEEATQEVNTYIAELGSNERIGGTVDSVMAKMNNAEYINDSEINSTIDTIFSEVESINNDANYSDETKKALSDKLMNIAEQLDNYEFRTKTETIAVTQRGTAPVAGQAPTTKISAEKFFEGQTAEVNGVPATFKSNKGRTEAVMDNGETVVLDTPTMKINEGDFEFDDAGALMAVTVTDRFGTTARFTGDIAMDLAIKQRENEIGTVEQADFDTVYKEVETKYVKESPKGKTEAPVVKPAQVTPVETELEAREKDLGEKLKAKYSELESQGMTLEEMRNNPEYKAIRDEWYKSYLELQEQTGEAKTGKDVAEQEVVAEVKPTAKTVEQEVEEIGQLVEGSDVEIDRIANTIPDKRMAKIVARAAKAISRIAPGVKFKIHATDAEYRLAIGDDIDEDISGGAFDIFTNTIHINLENANYKTVAHEVFHAILFNKLRTDKNIATVTKKMIEAISSKLDGNSELKKYLDDFVSNYEDNLQNEEKLSELVGILAENYMNAPTSVKDVIYRWIDRLAKMFGLDPFQRNEVYDMLNTIARKTAKGKVIKESDVKSIINNIESVASESNGESGSVIAVSIINRKQINNSLDKTFNTSIEYDDTNLPDKIKMPSKSTIDKVLEKSGGAAIFINSDGTKVGVRRNGDSLQGGWRYTYLVENQDSNIGFAATSTSHVGTMHKIANALAEVRDYNTPSDKGKPIAVFITIQNADSMLGEWYTGEFFMEGIDEAITKGMFKGGVKAARKLMIDALTNKPQIKALNDKIAILEAQKESTIDKNKIKEINDSINKLNSQIESKKKSNDNSNNKKFIALINSNKFDTHEGRIEISRELASKKFSFGYRVGLLKQLIPLKSATGANREIKKALLDVNYGRKEFYEEHMDEILLDKLKSTDYLESSIGGITMGGFYLDPYTSYDDFMNNRTNGVNHAQFNESFSSNGETFLLDGAINVNNLSPEMGYPTTSGYELYNKKNNTSFNKSNTSLSDRFAIAEFLSKETNNNSKYLTAPFTSIGGSMYTSRVIPIKPKEETDITKRKQKKVYNASPKGITELGKRSGVVYFATDKREADAYAQMNRGKVREFEISEADIVDEKVVRDKITELGLMPKDKDYTVEESNVYELIDNRFDNSLSDSDIKKLFDALKQDGIVAFSYEDGAQVSGRTTESIAVIDTDVVQGMLKKQQNKKQKDINKVTKLAKSKGFSNEAIVQYLRKEGFSEDQINEVLAPYIFKDDITQSFSQEVDRLVSEGATEENAFNEAMDNIVYKIEDDIVREELARELMKEYGKKIKSAPRAEKITGKAKPITITTNDVKGLNDIIKREAKAAKDKKKQVDEVITTIAAQVKDLVTKGSISIRQMSAIINALKNTNFDNQVMVDRFMEYVLKVVSNADYIERVSKGLNFKKAIKRNLKGKANPFVSVAKSFTELNPKWVVDINKYNEIAELVFNSVKPTRIAKDTVNFKKEADIETIAKYIAEEQENHLKIHEANVRDRYERITGKESEGKTIEEMNNILLNLKDKKDYSSQIAAELKEKLAEYKKMVTNDDLAEVKAAVNVDLNLIDTKMAISILDALDTYFANGSNASLKAIMATYDGIVAVNNFNGKAKALRMLGSKKIGRLQNEQFTNINMMFKRLFRGQNAGQAFSEAIGFNNLVQGSNRAERQSVDKQNEYTKRFKNVKNFNSAENIFERDVIARLRRRDVNANEQDSFNKRLKLLKDSVDVLRKSGTSTEIAKADVYEKVFKKLGLYNDNVNIKDVLSKSEKFNIDAVDFVIDMFSEIYPQLSDTALGVYNTILANDIDYTPDKYSNLDSSIPSEFDVESSGFMSFNSNYTLDKNSAGVLIETTRPSKLPTNMYIDLDFDRNMFRSYKLALNDMYTAEAIRYTNAFLKSDKFAEIIPTAEDRRIVASAIQGYVSAKKGKNYIERSEMNFFNSFLDAVGGFGAVRALAGFSQFINQWSTANVNTMINAGEHMRPGDLFNKDIATMIANSGLPISNIGIEALTTIENADKELEKAGIVATVGGAVDKYTLNYLKKWNALLLKQLLANPDRFARVQAFAAYYRKSMKAQGLKVDWKAPMNEKAAKYAQSMIDANMDVSDTEMRGQFFKSKNAYVKIIKQVFFPFATFSMNQRNRVWSDAAVVVNAANNQERAMAFRSLVAFSAEFFTYNAIRYEVGLLMIKGAILALQALGFGLDDEEEKKIIEKYKENLIKSIKSSAITDVISPTPVLDEVTLSAMNKMMPMFGIGTPTEEEFQKYIDEINEERIYKGKEKLTEDEVALKRNKYMLDEQFQFYIDNEKSTGMLGIQLTKIQELYDIVDAYYTGKYMKKKYAGGGYEEVSLSDDAKESLKYIALLKLEGTILGPRESDQIANRMFKIVKDTKTLTEAQKAKYDVIKKDYKIDPYKLSLIKTTMKTENVLNEIEYIESTGGLTEKQSEEYAKLRAFGAIDGWGLDDIRKGKTAKQIIASRQ